MISISGKSKNLTKRVDSSLSLPKLKNQSQTRNNTPKVQHNKKKEKNEKVLPMPKIREDSQKRSETKVADEAPQKLPSGNIDAGTPLSVREIALQKLSAPLNDSESGHVTVKFNIYNKQFPIYNGVLRWVDIDEEYAFSFVYKGNYTRELRVLRASESAPGHTEQLQPQPNKAAVTYSYDDAANINDKDAAVDFITRDDVGDYFIGLMPGLQLLASVEEDAVAGVGVDGLTIRRGPIVFNSTNTPIKSGNNAVQEITKELLAMDVSRLQSTEAARLRELRDIEDVLFSSSG